MPFIPTAQIVALALVITLAVPVVLVAVEWVLLAVSERVAGWWHTAAVFVLATSFGLVLGRHMGIHRDLLAEAFAVAVGAAHGS